MIQPPAAKESKILVGVPTGEFSRQAVFYDHLEMLDKPVGTYITRCHGQSPARARNIIIKEAIRHNCTHLLFVDDDCAFPPNALMKLLDHDVDMVTGLYLMRNHPHQPLIFDYADNSGRCNHRYLSDGSKGLIEIVASGLGFCLIKTAVFIGMDQDPDNKGEWVRLGELERDHWCDDIGFFHRARKAGFKLFVDLECPIGHMGVVTLWPNRIDGVWNTAYDTSGREVATVPQIKNNREAFNLKAGLPLWSEPMAEKDQAVKYQRLEGDQQELATK